jgi:arylsulfatase
MGEAPVERTIPFIICSDEGVDVGVNNETAITDGYKQSDNRFTGKIHKVTVETK